CLLGGGPVELRLPWSVPLGSFHVGLDALSSFFLVLVLLVSALCAVYGLGHRRAEGAEPDASWLFYGLLAAGMALVVAARDGVLFLAAWEVMSLASFFLVVRDDGEEEVRAAGWTLLVAGQLGAAALLGLFVWLGRGGLDFTALAAPTQGAAGALFLLALVGFGIKAGFVPFHAWLPEAYPAAPGHVAAVMSGVMIDMGVYGFLRTLGLLGPPPAWWGWTLVGAGALGGVGGGLLSAAQRDLKRALAYSSVENMGVVALGLGLGLLGRAYADPVLAALGFGGALLHVLNHSLFKSLLFMGAGTASRASGTGDLEGMGGLLKRMPATGTCFLAGSAALMGLPPFNGFFSELLVMLAA
ncbi:MAG: oxidoreductase, partial [Elusimicrobia bacterium]|nr:oxidoreductase [Elusimicrobiota bacterium]